MFKLPISHLGGDTELMVSLELRGEVRQGWSYTFGVVHGLKHIEGVQERVCMCVSQRAHVRGRGDT